MIIKKYFSFLLCILILYFTSSENTFCYAREIDYLCGNRVHNRPCGVPVSIFNVLDFGAIGDGETDDTQVTRLYNISYTLEQYSYVRMFA